MNFKNRLFWIVAIASLILDRLTKYWVVQSFELKQTWPLWPGVFHFTYIRNDGAALGLFPGGVGWLRWVSLVASLGLMMWAWFGPSVSRWEQLGWGFILGGALGNGIDRFVSGSVVDFLYFRLINFPWIFNLADVFVNVGVCLLIVSFWKPPQSKHRTKN